MYVRGGWQLIDQFKLTHMKGYTKPLAVELVVTWCCLLRINSITSDQSLRLCRCCGLHLVSEIWPLSGVDLMYIYIYIYMCAVNCLLGYSRAVLPQHIWRTTVDYAIVLDHNKLSMSTGQHRSSNYPVSNPNRRRYWPATANVIKSAAISDERVRELSVVGVQPVSQMQKES